MPELPDVETFKRYIERTSLQQRIQRVAVLDDRVLKEVTAARLGRGLAGASLTQARRRAKYVLVSTDRDSMLLLHFGMSGEPFYREKGQPKPRWSRVEFNFDNGACLHYVNMRLIGRVSLFPTTDESQIPVIAELGPEPLDRSFTFKRFEEALAGHDTTIHQVLMDQSLIAGIGNLFSDEITYQAGVRPDRKVGSLSDAELRRLYDKMKWTLKRAIELDADLDGHPKQFIIPHRGPKGECPRGNAMLVKKTIGGRTSYFCPICQK